MLGKLMGRGGEPRRRKDKAIVHETVPDEVLYPDGKPSETVDNSWMNDVLPEAQPAPSAPAAPQPSPAAAAPTSRPVTRSKASPSAPQARATDAVAFPDIPANDAPTARPRYSVGWLVVVEGPGTGNWFPLESGVSSLGWSDGQTICLPQPATADAGANVAAISYDKGGNSFAVKSVAGDALRLNGVSLKAPARLRDGDVFSFGGIALKLVALCGGNFRWTETEAR